MCPAELEITPLPLPDYLMTAYLAALTAYAEKTTLRPASDLDRSRMPAEEADWLQSDSAGECDLSQTVCENCHEAEQIAKIKGCIRCLKCGFKGDCSGI